jgi:hypothetical protein
MLVDQKTEGVIVPLNHALTEAKGKLELANSEYHIFVRNVCLIFLWKALSVRWPYLA